MARCHSYPTLTYIQDLPGVNMDFKGYLRTMVDRDASDLYLAMWNRNGDEQVTISGDRDVVDLWHDNVRIRWS